MSLICYSYTIMSIWTQAQAVAWALPKLQCLWRESLIPPPPAERPCPSCLQHELPLCSCPSHQPGHTMPSSDSTLLNLGSGAMLGSLKEPIPWVVRTEEGQQAAQGGCREVGKVLCPWWCSGPCPAEPLPLAPVQVTPHTKVACCQTCKLES